jgi:hypothetical protein
VIAAGVLVVLVLLLVLRRSRRKGRRNDSADVLSEVLFDNPRYRGQKWKVGDPWV